MNYPMEGWDIKGTIVLIPTCFVCLFLVFLEPYPWHMEVSRVRG